MTTLPALPAFPTDHGARRDTLAPWTYLSAEFYQLEMQLFRQHWMLAGHISELQTSGDFITFDAVGERALIVVDEHGELRAFHNVCRHRGARLLQGSGNCKHRISCPFHGWTYGLSGELKGIPLVETFDQIERHDYSLKSLPLEVWHGLVFISFSEQDQSIAARFHAMDEHIAPYRIAEMTPLSAGYTELRPYNWKVIHDIDNEGYHVPVGHPSLQQLYGADYEETLENGIPVASATINSTPARLWSVRHYQRLLPAFDHLPSHRQRSWWYLGIFPNAVIALYPDSVEYYMTVPVSVAETRYIGRQFGLPDTRRETAAARYLNMRINSFTEAEDESFVRDMQEGMRSSAFPEPTLSSREAGVRHFHAKIQAHFPVASLATEPAPGTVDAVNRELLDVARTL